MTKRRFTLEGFAAQLAAQDAYVRQLAAYRTPPTDPTAAVVVHLAGDRGTIVHDDLDRAYADDYDGDGGQFYGPDSIDDVEPSGYHADDCDGWQVVYGDDVPCDGRCRPDDETEA